MSELLQILTDAIENQQCQLIQLSNPRKTRQEIPERISIKPFMHKNQIKYQWAKRVGKQEVHENMTPQETAKALRKPLESDFALIKVRTITHEYEGTWKEGKNWQVKSKAIKPAELVIADHNQAKNYLIPEGIPCRFLVEIGVMNSLGKVLQPKYAKFRQINRFLELVQDILMHLKDANPLRVVDYGCGKSYLTFALHHLLHDIHKISVEMTGLDVRGDVITECLRVKNNLELSGLDFQVSSIGDYQETEKVDLAVSLHACDTATDDALIQAVKWNSTVILSVPCCQHQFLHEKLKVEGLEAIHQHGILQERFCALATDAYRALALEALGYQTQIIEFIDMEHTPKNILLRAVKRTHFSEKHRNSKWQELDNFIKRMQISHNQLGEFVRSQLSEENQVRFNKE